MNLGELRKDYTRGGLDIGDAHPDPFEQFRFWFKQAHEATGHEPNAMTVCTVGPDGSPSARVLLLKGVDDRGFLFYTNYLSAKGRDLAANPQTALLFYWPELERQVRIAGRAEIVDRPTTRAYFQSRPRQSQIGAIASQQSEVIPDREFLENRVADLERELAGQDVPLPDYWGGYRVVPDELEFWQGRPSRLHDRLRYRRQAGEWIMERLSP